MPAALEYLPGIVKTESRFAEHGRYVDGDKVRFERGRPEKIGGNTRWSDNQFTGRARALLAWDAFNQNHYVAVGTHCKLQIYNSQKAIINVTPLRASGTLGSNPLSVTSGSAIVTVTHTAHGLKVDDTIVLAGATAVGGITPAGEYAVQAIPDANSYTIQHSAAAPSTATGGGASVTFEYEISCGRIDATRGGGWGIGGYGLGTYGTPRASATFVQKPRIWHIDTYGEDILANPNGGNLYRWDTSAGGRATIVANAPTNNLGVFVSDDRHVIVLGADGDALLLQWPDQSDITNWTPSVTSTANMRRISEGSQLVAGTVLQNRVNMVWTDTAAYRMQYTGTAFVFDTRVAGINCGLIGPKAFAVSNGIAYWMSQHDFFLYDGAVRPIPRADDVSDWVADNISNLQGVKTFCDYNSRFSEVWWWFVREGESEPSLYVAFDIVEQCWIAGTMARTASTDQSSGDKAPIMASSDSYLYLHEQGVDDNGAAMRAFIRAAPAAIGDGDAIMDVWAFFPNFTRHAGNITLTLNAFEHATEAETEDEVSTIAPGQGQVDTRISGRYVDWQIESNVVGGDFRIGKPRAEVQPAGRRRG